MKGNPALLLGFSFSSWCFLFGEKGNIKDSDLFYSVEVFLFIREFFVVQ
jgi:hypothetical protein